MITDPAQIDEIVGLSPAQIASLKATVPANLYDLIDELAKHLQRRPVALYEIRITDQTLTREEAMANILAKQDRSGSGETTDHDVPASKAEVEVKLDMDEGLTIPDNGQSVELKLLLQYFTDGPWEIGGQTVLDHDDNMSHGVDVGYKMVCAIDQERYPLKYRIGWSLPGTLNFGLIVNFIDPTP